MRETTTMPRLFGNKPALGLVILGAIGIVGALLYFAFATQLQSNKRMTHHFYGAIILDRSSEVLSLSEESLCNQCSDALVEGTTCHSINLKGNEIHLMFESKHKELLSDTYKILYDKGLEMNGYALYSKESTSYVRNKELEEKLHECEEREQRRGESVDPPKELEEKLHECEEREQRRGESVDPPPDSIARKPEKYKSTGENPHNINIRRLSTSSDASTTASTLPNTEYGLYGRERSNSFSTESVQTESDTSAPASNVPNSDRAEAKFEARQILQGVYRARQIQPDDVMSIISEGSRETDSRPTSPPPFEQ